MTHLRIVVCSLLILAVAGCSGSKKAEKPTTPATPSNPNLPQPQPTPEAKVLIRVVYPTSGSPKPAVDSNFIFGSVGNGKAYLTINGEPVAVAQNGAFLAFLRMPADGIYHLYAERGDDRDSATVSHTIPTPSTTPATPKPKPTYEPYSSLKSARVIKGSDTLETGSDVAPAAPTPDGDRRWFLPRGTVAQVAGKMGAYYKVQFDKSTEGWVADSNFEILSSATSASAGRTVSIVPAAQYVDLILPANRNPFLITSDGSSARITIYGSKADVQPTGEPLPADPFVRNIGYESTGASTDYTVFLTKPFWGYKAFYDANGALVVRLRRPPTVNASDPLRNLKIMIDPGHPPAGAIGPTGLTEAEANLAIASRIANLLRQRGANVLMTHTTTNGMVSNTNQTEELNARAQYAVNENVDMMVSVHNNAFPDGVNPFLNFGTSTYYYHPFAQDLAQQLDNEIIGVTGIRNTGANKKSLAICRPTWMPCALTESLYMMFPDQEQALRDPKFLDNLAAAHVRGIEDFLRGKLQ